MKRFPLSLLKPTALSVCILALAGCQAFEGLQDDIRSIDLSNFGTASSMSKQDQQSNFLIDGDCPKIEIVDELSTLHAFKDARKPSEDSHISTITLDDASSTCSYGERSVTVNLKLNINGEIGPAGREATSEQPYFSHPYFVAVTSSTGKILAKELFDASMTYKPGATQYSYIENLRQIIPADSRAKGSRIKVVIGFQLTQDQLAYNRAIIQRREATKKAFEEQQAALKKKTTMAKTTAKAVEIKAPKDKTLVIKAPETTTLVTQTPQVKVQDADIYVPDLPEGAEIQTKTFNRAGPIDITVP